MQLTVILAEPAFADPDTGDVTPAKKRAIQFPLTDEQLRLIESRKFQTRDLEDIRECWLEPVGPFITD